MRSIKYCVPIGTFILGAMFVLFVWSVVERNKSGSKVLSCQNETFILIEDNIEDEDIESDDNIFFIESHSTIFHKLENRQVCSVESAGSVIIQGLVRGLNNNFFTDIHLTIANPEAKIFLMFLTTKNFVLLESSSQIQVLTKYKNVQFKYLNVTDFSKDTPLESWLLTDKLAKSTYVTVHTSDVLRLLTLWKYGGTYLDLDVIVPKRLESNSSFACAENDATVNNAILRFSGKSGKNISEMCLDDLIKNFDGSAWDQNGPLLVSRVLEKLCGLKNLQSASPCHDFKLLPREDCYAIGWWESEKFMRDSDAEEVIRLTSGSHFIHIYNSITKKYRLGTDSKAAYITFAEKYCPGVYRSRDEFF